MFKEKNQNINIGKMELKELPCNKYLKIIKRLFVNRGLLQSKGFKSQVNNLKSKYLERRKPDCRVIEK